MSTPRADCLVVGAGIAGVCAALHIQGAGGKVTLVDPNPPGSGASSGNAGIVVNTKLTPVFAGLTPTLLFKLLRNPSSPLNVRWSRFVGLSPWFLKMLSHSNAADVERITRALAALCQSGERIYAQMWREAEMGDLVCHRGSLALNHNAEERDRDWGGILSLLRSIGVPMERVGPAEIRALAPAVGPRYTSGVFSPDFHHTLDPQAFVAKLCGLFEARGGARIQAGVHDIDVQAGKAAGLKTSQGTIAGGSVVLAAGTGSADLARKLGEPVPHQAVGGYHVMLGRPGVRLETPLLPLDFRFAITPMQAGIRLAGTYEFGGDGLPPTDRVLDDMLAHVGQVLPGINAERSSIWRGFRSYLPDGLPVIGRSRSVGDLYYLFGLSSAGMINAPASGRALGRLWSGEEAEFDMAPYAIDRFATRAATRSASVPARSASLGEVS